MVHFPQAAQRPAISDNKARQNGTRTPAAVPARSDQFHRHTELELLRAAMELPIPMAPPIVLPPPMPVQNLQQHAEHALRAIYASRGHKGGLDAAQLQLYTRVRDRLAADDAEVRAFIQNNDSKLQTRTLVVDGQRLVITRALKHGSFGKVHIGINEANQLVAVKVLREPNAADSQPRQTHATPLRDVVRELGMMGMVDSPLRPRQVLRVSSRTGNMKVYCVLPYAQGNAQAIMNKLAPAQRWAAAAALLLDCAAALTTLETRHVAHRDIKIDNILYDSEGHFFLGDFGLSEPTNTEGYLPGGRAGTLAYLPREGLGAYPAKGAPMDIWSLGLSAVALLLGGDALFTPTTPALHFDQLVDLTTRRHLEHAAWHAALPPANKRRRLQKYLAGSDSALRHFHLAYQAVSAAASPEAADFLFRRVLHPDPAQRVSAAELHAWAHTQITQSNARKSWVQAAGQLCAPNVEQRAVSIVLRAHQAALRLPRLPSPRVVQPSLI